MKQPKVNDVVLGGQTSPPVPSAILGGIAGVQQQMTVANPEQRSQLLATATNYGEAGIDLLIDTLNNDPVLAVRATAYQLLPSVDSAKAKGAIANGVLLNPGDRIYSVYKSAIYFNDEWFNLDNSSHNLMDEISWEELGYVDYEDFCINEGESFDGGQLASYIPRRVAYYFSEAEADTAAEQLHQ